MPHTKLRFELFCCLGVTPSVLVVGTGDGFTLGADAFTCCSCIICIIAATEVVFFRANGLNNAVAAAVVAVDGLKGAVTADGRDGSLDGSPFPSRVFHMFFAYFALLVYMMWYPWFK